MQTNQRTELCLICCNQITAYLPLDSDHNYESYLTYILCRGKVIGVHDLYLWWIPNQWIAHRPLYIPKWTDLDIIQLLAKIIFKHIKNNFAWIFFKYKSSLCTHKNISHCLCHSPTHSSKSYGWIIHVSFDIHFIERVSSLRSVIIFNHQCWIHFSLKSIYLQKTFLL